MLIKYRFSINGHYVNPSYKDDLAKDYALEPQQRFYRADLSGALKFMRDDFDWIMDQPFDTEYVVLLEKSNDGGLTWANYYTGVFFQADCQIDLDTKKIEVKLDTKDQYNEVLAGLEKEYDLLKLAPAKTPLTIQKRPLIQLYIPGDSVVSCFLGGNSWEQDVYESITDTNALVNTYYFALASTLQKCLVTGSGMTPDVLGEFVNEFVFSYVASDQKWYGRNQTYYVKYSLNGDPGPGGYPYIFELIRSSDAVVLFRSGTYWSVSKDPIGNELTLNAVSGSGATGSITIYCSTMKVYMRYLLDVETISGLNTYLIPANDIVENNRSYKRAIGYAIDCATISNRVSDSPTKYGISDDGKYFMMPYTPWGAKFYPIARSTWGLSSVWFAFETFDWILEEDGRKSYMMKDSMMISEAIRVLLNIIDPTITHDGTSDYSQFLYGTTNPITYGAFRVMITQKSNILAGEYDQPAQKAPVTLSAILAMLRDTMKVYWYIEDNKFKLEHISWFKNGGAYSGTPVTSFDLTTLIQQKNKKPWGFISSKYSYDKVDMAERYEFGWMDDVTEGFAGYPIEINSKYVQRGKIENVNISAFTSDIDYMLLNPGSISQDGFALFAALKIKYTYLEGEDGFVYYSDGTKNSVPGWRYEKYSIDPNTIYACTGREGTTSTPLVVYFNSSDVVIGTEYNTPGVQLNHDSVMLHPPTGTSYCIINTQISERTIVLEDYYYKLPYVQRTIDGAELRLQNGLMSFIYLHPNFWTYDLPSTDVTINEYPDTWVRGIERKKKQKVAFPSLDDPNPLQLIKTYLGDGQIEKLSVNLQSRMNDIELKYDTE